MTGTVTLVRFLLRRDRWKLSAWIAGIGGFVAYTAVAIPAAYPTEEDLAGAMALVGDPIGRMLVGPGYGLEVPTYERVIANGYGLYVLVLTALMNILLVVRHTRLEEQSGRAELVRASVVGRHAPLTACVVVAAVTNAGAGLAVFLAMVGIGGFGPGGSLLAAASAAATGLAFAAVATVAVQLTAFSRAAAGIAGATLGAAFVVRAGGDLAREGGTALSWLSPLAWAQQTAPFVFDRWWPLLLPVALAAAALATGYALSARRDLGAGLLGARPGPARAHPRLGTAWGLALRLRRGGLLGWALALAVSGLVFGAFADALLAADDLPDAMAELFGSGDVVAGYLAYMARFLAYALAMYGIVAVGDLRADETQGRAGPLLATPVGRVGWLGANLGLVAGAMVVLSAVVGIATGIGAAAVTGDAALVAEVTLAQVNQVPAIWVVLGVAVLCFGLAPRAIGVAWALLGASFLVGSFGPLLGLPDALLRLAPFGQAADYPVEGLRAIPLVVLSAIAAVLAAGGVAGLRRRDIAGA